MGLMTNLGCQLKTGSFLLIPVPKTPVLPRGFANIVDDRPVPLSLTAVRAALALQLLGAVNFVVQVRLLSTTGEGVALIGLAANGFV